MASIGNALPFSQLWQRTRLAVVRLPLPLLRIVLGAVATRLAQTRPDLFARMGVHARKTFLIDPVDLPFVFVMVPDTAAPQLGAYAKTDRPPHDGAISGRFLDLLDLIDGEQDGDALFFNRVLSVTGDVEAVVALRNALDDFDGDLVREMLNVFGPFAGMGAAALALIRNMRGSART